MHRSRAAVPPFHPIVQYHDHHELIANRAIAVLPLIHNIKACADKDELKRTIKIQIDSLTDNQFTWGEVYNEGRSDNDRIISPGDIRTNVALIVVDELLKSTTSIRAGKSTKSRAEVFY
jgi:hypothetical protein